MASPVQNPDPERLSIAFDRIESYDEIGFVVWNGNENIDSVTRPAGSAMRTRIPNDATSFESVSLNARKKKK